MVPFESVIDRQNLSPTSRRIDAISLIPVNMMKQFLSMLLYLQKSIMPRRNCVQILNRVGLIQNLGHPPEALSSFSRHLNTCLIVNKTIHRAIKNKVFCNWRFTFNTNIFAEGRKKSSVVVSQ